MAQSLTTIDKLLKDQYLPGIVDSFQEEDKLLKEFLKRKKTAKGGDTEILVRLGRNNGIGFRDDGDTLPAAGNSSWDRMVVDPKLAYAHIQVSGPAMARTDGGSAKAFLKALVDEMKHTAAHFKKRMNIALWGQEEGYLGQVASVTSSTIVLDGPGVGGSHAHAAFNAGTRHFAWAGDILFDVLDANDSYKVLKAGVGTTAINHSTNTLTVDIDPTSGTSVADGDRLILSTGLSAATAQPSYDFEGVSSFVDDGTRRGTIHGLSRTTYPELKAIVLKSTSSQRDLTESLLEDLCQSVYLNSGMEPSGKGYQLRCSQGIYSKFVATQLPIKRFQSTKLKSGHSYIDFNGIPVVPDVDAPYESMWLLNMDKFGFLEVDGMRWLDIDGKVLNRVTDKDAYEARWRWFGEAYCTDFKCQGVIENLNDTVYSLRS